MALRDWWQGVLDRTQAEVENAAAINDGAAEAFEGWKVQQQALIDAEVANAAAMNAGAAQFYEDTKNKAKTAANVVLVVAAVAVSLVVVQQVANTVSSVKEARS